MSPEPVTDIISDTGYSTPIDWATPPDAAVLASGLHTTYASNGQEIIRNPHLWHSWARDVVSAPMLARLVGRLLGSGVGVENSFLVIKWPRRRFVVPVHQDGIDEAIELDPGRSVCCWVAITTACADSGCLHVVPGSHLWGYLPYQPEPGERRGLMLSGEVAESLFVPAPLAAGQALLFDSRLVHRSGSNHTGRPRIGLNIRYATTDGFRRGTPDERPGWMPLDLP